MQRLDALFILIADSLGTNGCILLFCFIAFAPLYYQVPHTMLELQNYVSQVVIQLIALALLAKVSKLESARMMRLLQESHDTLLEELKIAREERKEIIEIHAQLNALCKNR